MEYKTPMVAKKLGVSPKVVMRIVQQLQLDLQKNKFGHYIFSEDDLQQILEYHQTPENTPVAEFPADFSHEEFASLKQEIQALSNRMTRNEGKLDAKADDVVNYQLLQHRSEIEELQKTIKLLKGRIEQLEVRKPYIAPVRENTAEKPKRRKMSLSIFGF
nr:hypothetical protein [Ectobacillus panaciterrae]